MRVVITVDPRDPHRDWVRGDAEYWLRHHARAGWSMRENGDSNGNDVLKFESDDPLDAIDFHMRAEAAQRRGCLD